MPHIMQQCPAFQPLSASNGDIQGFRQQSGIQTYSGAVAGRVGTFCIDYLAKGFGNIIEISFVQYFFMVARFQRKYAGLNICRIECDPKLGLLRDCKKSINQLR